MKIAAAKTSALLSLLFVVVYNACSWITAQRLEVGTFYFGWERLIPFIPLFIIPYMSIDLLFVAGPFLCKTPGELKTFSRRISLAIVLAGVCFLAMPLTLAVPRPQAGGWLGDFFKAFCAIDRPFNLFPSLHIALRTLLAELYGRNTRGLTRYASHLWFSLIGFSTLFTYQHHVIDVVGGFLLGIFCLWAVRDSPSPVTPNPRIGFYYAAGSLLCMITAKLSGWPGVILVWPGIALGLAAAGYFGAGPGFYGKKDGRLPWLNRCLMAPCLWGQQLSLRYYRRQCRAWDELAPGLLIGRLLTAEEANAARNLGVLGVLGVTAVLDLTAEFDEAPGFIALGNSYLNLPVLDLTAPTPGQLEIAVNFIKEGMSMGKVYVHCKIGYSRTAAVAGAWLLASGGAANAQEAIARLRAVRPSIVVRPEAAEALERFELQLQQTPA